MAIYLYTNEQSNIVDNEKKYIQSFLKLVKIQMTLFFLLMTVNLIQMDSAFWVIRSTSILLDSFQYFIAQKSLAFGLRYARWHLTQIF